MHIVLLATIKMIKGTGFGKQKCNINHVNGHGG